MRKSRHLPKNLSRLVNLYDEVHALIVYDTGQDRWVEAASLLASSETTWKGEDLLLEQYKSDVDQNTDQARNMEQVEPYFDPELSGKLSQFERVTRTVYEKKRSLMIANWDQFAKWYHALSLNCLRELQGRIFLALERHTGDETIVPTGTPHWDSVSGILQIEGKLARKVAIHAENCRAVLSAFQEQAWPWYIEDPLRTQWKNAQRVYETVKTLNENCRGIKFHAVNGGQGYQWKADPA